MQVVNPFHKHHRRSVTGYGCEAGVEGGASFVPTPGPICGQPFRIAGQQ